MQAGATIRQHLHAAWRSTGRRPADLDTPAAPESLHYLMTWFDQLAGGRAEGLNGPQPITWPDMQAWAQLLQIPLQPWQAGVLRQLDSLWRHAWATGRPKPTRAP